MVKVTYLDKITHLCPAWFEFVAEFHTYSSHIRSCPTFLYTGSIQGRGFRGSVKWKNSWYNSQIIFSFFDKFWVSCFKKKMLFDLFQPNFHAIHQTAPFSSKGNFYHNILQSVPSSTRQFQTFVHLQVNLETSKALLHIASTLLAAMIQWTLRSFPYQHTR